MPMSFFIAMSTALPLSHNRSPRTQPTTKERKTMSKPKQTMSIIPASTAAAIQPKPTKSEIIEALTRLKVEEIEAVNKINQAAYEKQNAICQELALECLKVA